VGGLLRHTRRPQKRVTSRALRGAAGLPKRHGARTCCGSGNALLCVPLFAVALPQHTLRLRFSLRAKAWINI